MRRAEAIEEIDERHAAFDGDEMSDSREIHDLLHACLGEHRAASLARSHDILVIAEDVQRGRRERTRRHMEDTGEQLAGNLVEVRNHQQEALRRRVGRRQSACLQRAVHSASGTGLRLHLDDANRLSEQVLFAMRGHLIHMLRHRRGRRDRIDRCDIRKRIRDVGGSRVAVHGFHLFAHVKAPLF